MDASMTWLVVAGVIVVCELLTGTFYLLMITLGLLTGALCAALGLGPGWQMASAAVVGAVATLALHNSRFGYRKGKPANRDPNVMLDIGQTLNIDQWQPGSHGHSSARAMYRGAMWDVECRQEHPASGLFTIIEVQGSRLIVQPT
ncbi:MAG: hypothetical protein RL748_401 [Pseudomonadota bacterium]|jgi:membrane protein implicated in regulation of membrane protease activity